MKSARTFQLGAVVPPLREMEECVGQFSCIYAQNDAESRSCFTVLSKRVVL